MTTVLYDTGSALIDVSKDVIVGEYEKPPVYRETCTACQESAQWEVDAWVEYGDGSDGPATVLLCDRHKVEIENADDGDPWHGVIYLRGEIRKRHDRT